MDGYARLLNSLNSITELLRRVVVLCASITACTPNDIYKRPRSNLYMNLPIPLSLVSDLSSHEWQD